MRRILVTALLAATTAGAAPVYAGACHPGEPDLGCPHRICVARVCLP